MCGGTPLIAPGGNCCYGLSPRVRGNHWIGNRIESPHRSIPACAGEPDVGQTCWTGEWVYPRVCGGTIPATRTLLLMKGLSPRVRGNLAGRPLAPRVDGSIPACAGEPIGGRAYSPDAPVYPRVCGGTKFGCTGARGSQGLSPRVRGNRAARLSLPLLERSIPACAGEPAVCMNPIIDARVYPRVCGGTAHFEAALRSRPGLSPRVRGNRRPSPGR